MTLVEIPAPCRHEHLVQFYGYNEARLARNVAAYLGDCLAGGGGAMIVADLARRNAILAHIRERICLNDQTLDKRIVLLDSRETLAAFMLNGRPDARLFEASVGTRVRELYERCGGVRAYGEMVGKLWHEQAFDAAIALEGLWNDLLERFDFGLFCGYAIDVLSEEFQVSSTSEILSSHTRLITALDDSFDDEMQRAMDEVLGERSHWLRSLTTGDFQTLAATLPRAEKTILRLRHSLPRYVDEILVRARTYHRYHVAS